MVGARLFAAMLRKCKAPLCRRPKYFGHFLFKTMAYLKKSSTNIVEEARRELDISRDDYALCSYLHYRQGYPNDKMPGWCIDTKDEIADFVGISRPGLYKMIDRLERIGLAESMPTTGFLRTTKLFIDTEAGCKQSLQSEKSDSVNKVYNECKQSLQGSVNKVTHKDYCNSKNISKIKNDNKEESEKNAFFGEAEKSEINHSFVEGKKEKLPPNSARPPKKKIRDWHDVLNELQSHVVLFINSPDGRAGWFDYLTHRNEIKAKKYGSAKSEALAIKHLYELTNGDAGKIQAFVNQSRRNGWISLNPLKEERQNTQSKRPLIYDPKNNEQYRDQKPAF